MSWKNEKKEQKELQRFYSLNTGLFFLCMAVVAVVALLGLLGVI